MTTQPTISHLPLSGVRVLDLTRLLPGPWCTLMLGDLGAEIVKVERPDGGDNSRAARPRFEAPGRSESVYFCSLNRNKRSITLDLKNPTDLATFRHLADEADVLVESFRPGVADRLGVGHSTLRASNPGLVYCAISGYGQTGPRSHLPGHDLNIAGLSGLLALSPSQPPALPGMLVGDYAGGAMALIGILAALAGRRANGQGAFLDISMLDAAISWTGVQMSNVLARAYDPSASDKVEGWGGNPRYNIYRARDGRHLTVSLLEKHFWIEFCRHVGREDLIDPAETEADRLTTHGERGALYRSSLTEIFATRDRDDWTAEMTALGIPICPVLSPDEVFASAPDAKRGWFMDVGIPGFERPVPQPGFPFVMQTEHGSGFSVRRPPPQLGEANGASDHAIWPSRVNQ